MELVPKQFGYNGLTDAEVHALVDSIFFWMGTQYSFTYWLLGTKNYCHFNSIRIAIILGWARDRYVHPLYSRLSTRFN